ncbi:MAG: Gx transporter family protein [Oscillospiraceae bacterium]|nr:Gx transporter family protein [Oscillospiraceae bacterium]MCD7852868.1 Gx transporter family protein [Oscillospiraceae bacterium]
MSVRRLTRAAVLTAVALVIFIIELQIPTLVPVPGVKLGLANIVTVFSMFLLGPADTAAILVCRILLGSMFSGQMMSLLYSMSGGLLCYLVMLLMRNIVTYRQIWVCSVVGAIAHNIGQIAVAILVTNTPALLAYLPVLMVSGIIAGLFTGFCAQFAVTKLKGLSDEMERQNGRKK